MNIKFYTAEQAAEELGISYHALRKRLERDSKLDAKKRSYPNAFKLYHGGPWLIPEKDLLKNKRGDD